MTPHPPKARKPKVCKCCKASFTPQLPMATCCSPMCALTFAKSKRAKAEKVAAVKDRRETKAKLEQKKDRNDWIADVQVVFNRFIRTRDAGLPCICCGKPIEPHRPGGSADAGHYLSRGSSPHLRFDERNVHTQRKNCNRPGGTTRLKFRAGMIARIGLAAVEALECDQSEPKWTIDQLKAMKADYTARARALLKERE